MHKDSCWKVLCNSIAYIQSFYSQFSLDKSVLVHQMCFRFLNSESRIVLVLLQKCTLTFYDLYLAKQNIQRYNLMKQRKLDKHCKMLLLIWMTLLCLCQRFVLSLSLSLFLMPNGIVNSTPFSSNQDGYRDILKMADNFSSFNQWLRYAHYRPSLPVKSDPRSWWKYAYKVGTHEMKKARYVDSIHLSLASTLYMDYICYLLAWISILCISF